MSTEQDKFANQSNTKGAWKRNPTQFHGAVSTVKDAEFPAEKGRYRLYVNYGCPWAGRALIVWKLKGLEDVVHLTHTQTIFSPVKSFDENNYGNSDSYVGWE
eukprot:snap_masked-scaffold_46-processed-gene-1.62-mRNA-1 protein AED:0.35 eAED:0.37 QI:0/0/0/1/1/1/2/0/101